MVTATVTKILGYRYHRYRPNGGFDMPIQATLTQLVDINRVDLKTVVEVQLVDSDFPTFPETTSVELAGADVQTAMATAQPAASIKALIGPKLVPIKAAMIAARKTTNVLNGLVGANIPIG